MAVPRRRLVAFSGAFVASALVLGARPAAAQGNYRLAPVGGRTTLVGGTGLAYGRDSASAFLNPATIVRVDPGRLAFSVNFYLFSVVTADKWYQPGDVDRSRFGDIPSEGASITNIDFDTLPGSLCVFLKAGDIGFLARSTTKELKEHQARLGVCLASVQSSVYSFNAEDYSQSFGGPGARGLTRQAGSIRQTFRRFAIGPSYAMYVDDHLAIGTSLHFSRASFRSSIGNTAITSIEGRDPISSVFYKTSRGDSHELTLSLGATYRFGHQTVAFTVEAPSFHLFGSGGTNLYTHLDGADTATASASAAGEFTANTPLRVALGTGYEAPWGSAELNVSFHAPLTNAYKATLSGSAYRSSGGTSTDALLPDVELTTRSRGTMNIGVGGEVFLAPQVSLLGGLSTDFTAVPRGALATDPFSYFPANTNRVATSFGWGSHGEGGDLLLGAELSYGWGERLAVNAYQLPPRLEPTSESQYALLFVLAGSTSFKAIKRAVEDVTKVLDPSKTLVPKKEPLRDIEPMKTDKQTEAPKPDAAKPDPTKPDVPAVTEPATKIAPGALPTEQPADTGPPPAAGKTDPTKPGEKPAPKKAPEKAPEKKPPAKPVAPVKPPAKAAPVKP